MSSTTNNQAIAASVNQWLDDVVIGLNLCPFAAKPQRNQQIKIYVSNATREEELLQDILDQLLELDTKAPQELETTLVVVPDMLHDLPTTTSSLIGWKRSFASKIGRAYSKLRHSTPITTLPEQSRTMLKTSPIARRIRSSI